jgi:hypothetical protein
VPTRSRSAERPGSGLSCDLAPSISWSMARRSVLSITIRPRMSRLSRGTTRCGYAKVATQAESVPSTRQMVRS